MPARCANSSAWASRIKMPRFAATPVPAMMAAGVASPSAQGQAITITATLWISATSKPAPTQPQAKPVIRAMPNTTGTNTAAIWSTKRWIGALAAWASSTKRMICDSSDVAPTAVTRSCKDPSPLSVPPRTCRPGVLCTGSGSPVSIDSSTLLSPSISSPSAGMRSPGSTRNRSPGKTSAIGNDCSPSGVSTRAVWGRKACSAPMASSVLRLARASSHLPNNTRVMTTAEPSKYKSGPCPWCSPGWLHHSQTDRAQPALVPKATSRSMLPVPARKACQPAL